MKLLLLGATALALAACGGEGSQAAGGTDYVRPPDTALAADTRMGAGVLPGDTAVPELVETPGAWALPGHRDWTAGIVHAGRPGVGMTTVTAARAARNDGYERFVIEFEGDTVPGYHLEYVDRPVRQCGSGNPVALEGDGWLRIRLEPARAHTDAGEPTIGERRLRPGQPVIREAVLTCDFEGQVEWVLGVASPNAYRVMELGSPARLVVDVRSD